MDDKKYRCKFCSKVFNNGRALGGHIRSHGMGLNPRDSRAHEEETDEEDAPHFKRSKWVGKSRTHEEETDEEDAPHFKRSKRVRKSRISETSDDEYVAYCLVLLSKDKWVSQEDENEEEEEERGKHRCEKCKKVFRSYQALGGHMASHNKKKMMMMRAGGVENRKSGNAGGDERIHECPICCRVFDSGQALGGHKRSHFSGFASRSFGHGEEEAYSAAFSSSSPSSTIDVDEKQEVLSRNLIDLNLPAPMNDDDGGDDDEFQFLTPQ